MSSAHDITAPSPASPTAAHQQVARTEGAEPTGQVVRNILALMGPTAVGSVLAFSAQAITNSFVGRRLGAEAFAHYTLGVSVANLFGFSIGIGLNGALDTFISQAYGRDKQATKDIGVSMQRACFLSLIAAIPLSCVLMWGGPLFRLMFGEDLGNGALAFTRHAVPNLVLSFGTNILTKVIQAINLPELVVYSTGTAVVACLVVNYYITYSIATAVLALTITFSIQLIVLIGIIRFHPSITFWKHCDWPSKDAYSMPGLRQFLAVGIPSLIAVCAEWWAFEALDVVAASISVHAVAAVNLVLTIGALVFSIALSIAVASSVLVGNALGENKPVLAKQYAIVGLKVAQAMNLLDATLLVVFRHQIAQIFTHDPALEETFCNMILVIAVYIWGDSTQYCLQSIFRSTGQQHTAAKVVLVSLWAIGIPMAVFLGKWMGMGAMGVVMGLVCGFVAEIPLMLRYLASWPWEALAEEASKRLDEELHGGDQHAAVESGGGAAVSGGTISGAVVAASSAVHPHAKVGYGDANEAAAEDEVTGSLVDNASRVSNGSGGWDAVRHSVAAAAVAAMAGGGVGAAVHVTPPLVCSHGAGISPRHLDADEDLGFGRITRPVTVGRSRSGSRAASTPPLQPAVATAAVPRHEEAPAPVPRAAGGGGRPLVVTNEALRVGSSDHVDPSSHGGARYTDIIGDIPADSR